MKYKFWIHKTLLTLSVLLLVFSCTTKPLIQLTESDPLSHLPGGEDFYLLTRPSENKELIFEILRDQLPLSPSELYPALERTSATSTSGSFGKPLSFSGSFEGRFPAYFVRRSLKKSPLWVKEEEKTYRGPQNILADTLYQNKILTASDKSRLTKLQAAQLSPLSGTVLSASDKDWWFSGTPALMFYVPELSALPLPEGMPKVPGQTSLVLSLWKSDEDSDRYQLSADFRFADARSARMWNLGLRIFLAGRLGLSVQQEERDAMTALSLKTEGSEIHLTNWVLSPTGWGRFISSFSTPF